MAVIKVLDDNTIDKIAAGEVVERPASVVKELVENAIDAGCDGVTVEIREGGILLIRVTDNGCGIPSEDVATAFMRHATSKIRAAEDLIGVTSLGFRGEALSSIAAVSMVELITKTNRTMNGIRVCLDAGKQTEYQEVGAPDGTTIIVRNLFFNTPVRRKFLKSGATEGGYIADLMEHMAMSKPQISFKFITNGKTKFHTSGSGDLKEVIYRIFGREIAAGLIYTEAEGAGMRLQGYLGQPTLTRSNRNFENYFVDGRYIKSKIIARALEEGYKGNLMQHKYPFAVLHLSFAPGMCDVNVHPAKMDVRFSNQMQVHDFIRRSVADSLRRQEMIPGGMLIEESKASGLQQEIRAPEPFETGRRTAGLKISELQLDLQQVQEQGRHAWQKKPDVRKEDLPLQPEIFMTETEIVAAAVVPETVNAAAAVVPASDNAAATTVPASDNAVAAVVPASDNAAATAVPASDNIVVTMVPASDNIVATMVPASDNIAAAAVPDSDNIAATVVPASVTVAAAALLTAEEMVYTTGQGSQISLFEDRVLSEQAREEYEILGQLFDTYWVIAYRDKVLFVDQHAAHEKVKYERLIHRLREKAPESQLLFPPVIVSLTAKEMAALLEYESYFTAMGFELEEFGGGSIAIRSVPAELYGNPEKQFFMEMLDELMDGPVSGNPSVIEEKLASMACRAAVKGNRRMSVIELKVLIDELLTLDNPYHCPHGRPTIISMSRYEMEKKFKRIL